MWTAVVLIAVGLGLAGLLYWAARQAGASDERADVAEKSAEHGKDAAKIDEDVAKLDDATLDERLRNSK